VPPEVRRQPLDPPAAKLLGIRARWGLMPLVWRVVVSVVAGVIVIGALVQLTSAVTEGSTPTGPSSSSYSPASNGLEAYDELLSRSGRHVVQLTVPLTKSQIGRGSTLLIASPQYWTSGDVAVVQNVLSSAGRVVLMGQPPAGLLAALLAGSHPTWSSAQVETAASTGGGPLVYGVTQVESSGPGAWSSTGSANPVLVSDAGFLALFAQVDGGNLVLVATPAPVSNELIGQADNAAFALDIAGSSGTTVVFDEYDHGYGHPGGGYGGLPNFWKAALILGLIAVLVWMWSASRRIGPPEDPERLLPPPRIRYVDAIATMLSTVPPSRLVTTTAPVRAHAREELCRISGVSRDASDEVLSSAAHNAGVDPSLVDAILKSVSSESDIVDAGSAASALAGRRWG
jgi:hypothetical protein